MTSSPFRAGCFTRIVPRSFLKRDPILLDPCWFPGADVSVAMGERRGIASTLVDADTRVGAEILLGLIRFRGSPCPSLIFGIDGDLRNAAVAASALRCTSKASCIGSRFVDGDRGDSMPPGLEGIVATEGDVTVGDMA